MSELAALRRAITQTCRIAGEISTSRKLANCLVDVSLEADRLEQALRENVLKPLDEGYHLDTSSPLYDEQHVNFAHGHLARILGDD